MNIVIPDVFKVGAFTIGVKKACDMKNAQGTKLNMRWTPDVNTLELDDALGEETVHFEFVHGVLKATNDIFSLKVKEHDLRVIAIGLHQVLDTLDYDAIKGSVCIGPSVWAIRFVKDLVLIRQCFGECHPLTSTLKIDAYCSKCARREVIIHESLEAVFSIYDIAMDHHMLSLLATATTQAFETSFITCGY